MKKEVLAYLAGAIDSDGHIGIKKSTYRKRVRFDAVNASYTGRLGLKQIPPTVPNLLYECFGGYRYKSKPESDNSYPMEGWQATDQNAYRACVALLPYLRIKHEQARIVLELQETRGKNLTKVSYWFAKEFKNWRSMELITITETAELMGYKSVFSVSQAITNGTLLALPYTHGGIKPRVPRLLVERIVNLAVPGHTGRPDATELVEWRERLYQRARELNKVGINGTPLYHLTGPYTKK